MATQPAPPRYRGRRPLQQPGSGRAEAPPTSPTQADAVVLPEGVRVDEGAGHPRLVGGQLHDLETRVRDAQRRLAETVFAGRLEAPAGVIARVTLEKNQRHTERVDPAEALL